MDVGTLLSKLDSVRKTRSGWDARCPAHEDRRASLSVSAGDDGRILLHCHAGCAPEAVVGAMGLSLRDLMVSESGNGKPRIAATYDYRAADGKLLFQVVRSIPKGFRQRRPDGNGGFAWNLQGVERVPYRLPELLAADSTAWVFVVEGEKDADKLAALGLVATCNAGGAGKWRDEYAPHLAGRRVCVLPDNDTPGKRHAEDVAASLAGVAASVRVVTLPGLPDKGDVVDWLANGGTPGELAALADAAPKWQPDDDGQSGRPQAGREGAKPRIIVGFDEKRVADEAICAIESEPNLYQRGGRLVQVVDDTKPPKGIARPEGAPRISILKAARLREIMAERAAWMRLGEKGPVPCHVPGWVVDAVAARDQWPSIRALEGVVESPVLRRDGSVLAERGYDEATGLVFHPHSYYPPNSVAPTRDEATQAAIALTDVVCDFPFASTTHEAAWLAAALTPFARFAFHGPAPLSLIDANVRGSGKSLLADVTGTIFSWRGMARMTAPKDDDEARKRITAIALAGDNLVLIDNITGTLGGASLSAALTATTWSDRVLGRSEMVSDVPLTATWYATANNAILGPDMARRLLHIRLESPEEKPEERSGFKRPRLLKWVRREQPRLAVAAVTILAAYCHAGQPAMNLTPWGSFEAWSDLVRAAVVWIGMPDPGETRGELATTADSEANALRMMIAALEQEDPNGEGLTAREMIKMVGGDDSRHEALRAAIGELAPTRGDKTPSAKSLGMKLHHLRRRMVGGKCIDKVDTRMGAQWTVQK